NRGIPHPYEPLGIWLIDQWRQIGLNVKQEIIEASAYHPMLKRGDFEVAMDFQCGFIVEPDLDLPRFLSTSDANYGKHKDTVIDELYEKQGPATAGPSRSRPSTKSVPASVSTNPSGSSSRRGCGASSGSISAPRCGRGRRSGKRSSFASRSRSRWP